MAVWKGVQSATACIGRRSDDERTWVAHSGGRRERRDAPALGSALMPKGLGRSSSTTSTVGSGLQKWSRAARLWYTAEGRGSSRWEPLRSDLVSAQSGGSLTYLIFFKLNIRFCWRYSISDLC